MSTGNICPYCGQEMQLGYFGGGYYQLEWIPEGKGRRWTILSKCTGIPLSKPSIFRFHKTYAYHCSQCKIFILSEDNEE